MENKEIAEEIKSIKEEADLISKDWKSWSQGDLITMVDQLKDIVANLSEQLKEGRADEENG